MAQKDALLAHHAGTEERDIPGLAVCGQGPHDGPASAVLAAGDEDGDEDCLCPQSTTKSPVRKRQVPDRIVEQEQNLLEFYRLLDGNELVGDDPLPEITDEDRAKMLRKVMKHFIPPLERGHGLQCFSH